MKVSIGFNWLKLDFIEGLLRIWRWNFGFRKRKEFIVVM